ncbi:MAG: hypothetical protein GWN58_56205, partial [Anaerolineae bacterium]|nr:hypothetical protein [Anaerolineae bacterium]
EQLVATDEGISYTVGAAVLEDEEPAAGVLDAAEDDEAAEEAEVE